MRYYFTPFNTFLYTPFFSLLEDPDSWEDVDGVLPGISMPPAD